MLVVSGGYLPGSLRGSEKLFNNQWHKITWMHTWVSMHLRCQNLKSWKKYMFYQAPLNVFRQEKRRRKISLFSRDSDHSSWTPLWVFILVWRPDAYSCTHFLFHSDYYFFKMVHISIARDLGKEIYRLNLSAFKVREDDWVLWLTWS